MAATAVAALQEIELAARDTFVRTGQAGRRVEAAARDPAGRRGLSFILMKSLSLTRLRFADARAANQIVTLCNSSVNRQR